MRGPDTCGYDPCPCRGVHFISGFRNESDYCVDGQRVRLSDASRILNPSATEEQVLKLESHLLESYADYLRSRSDAKRPWRRETPVCPFSWTLPLKRYQPEV